MEVPVLGAANVSVAAIKGQTVNVHNVTVTAIDEADRLIPIQDIHRQQLSTRTHPHRIARIANQKTTETHITIQKCNNKNKNLLNFNKLREFLCVAFWGFRSFSKKTNKMSPQQTRTIQIPESKLMNLARKKGQFLIYQYSLLLIK